MVELEDEAMNLHTMNSLVFYHLPVLRFGDLLQRHGGSCKPTYRIIIMEKMHSQLDVRMVNAKLSHPKLTDIVRVPPLTDTASPINSDVVKYFNSSDAYKIIRCMCS